MSRKDEYRAYLQSEEWAEIRRQIYRDADGCCLICLAPAEAVHHDYYPKDLKDDTVLGKRAVCDRCHRALHGIHEFTPRERAHQAITRAMADLMGDTGITGIAAAQYTSRIMFIMARYYKEAGR